jgi:Spirocyclase AveC-like
MAISMQPYALDADGTAVSRGSSVSEVERRKVTPVTWWAALGAGVLVFEVVVLTHWVTSSLFTRVPTGVTDPPFFMKAAIVAFEVTCIPAMLVCIYLLVVRPWRRNGRLSTDGALTIAFATLWFADPLSAYSGPWFTYNSWAVNFGSWVNSIPGALAPAKPGKMIVEPLLIIPGVYVWVFVLTMFLGAWVIRKAQARWPRMGTAGLCAICVGVLWAFDVVFEGIVFMPLGIWEYPGGHLSLFPNTYHKFPLLEMFTAGTLFAAVACVRFFRDDRGETIAERGLSALKVSPRRKDGLRALAMIGVVHLMMFVCYNLPNTWSATHSAPWPADLQNRSYLNDGICGVGTTSPCPAPARSIPNRG